MPLAGQNLWALEPTGTLISVDDRNGVLPLQANGRERTVPVADNAEFLTADGKALAGGLKSAALTPGAVVTISVTRSAQGLVLRTLRLGGRDAGMAVPAGGKTTVGLKPLTEMTADDRYKGEDVGLDGTHPSPTGRQKVASMLLAFFTQDSLASRWFAPPALPPAPRRPQAVQPSHHGRQHGRG